MLSHMNADGDACGSILGCTLMLDQAAPQAASVVPILPNGCPSTFDWLPGSSRILSGEPQREQCESYIAEADLIVCLDFSTASRVDFLQDALVKAQAHKVLIDHHHNPALDQFHIVISDSQISSTCELVLWIAIALWERKYLNTNVARCLYAGLRTDTGGFAFSCNQPNCFDAAALLVSYDIHPADIHNHITNTFSFNRMMFYGFALSQRLYVYPEKKVALFAFSLADQLQFNVTGEDMEGLVNYTLMMQEIEVGALLREEPNRTKVSFRSKYDVDVNLLAQHFGGGGHTKAAGATCQTPFADALIALKQILGVADQEPIKFISAA
ncbi:MAG: DHH family phosphoesterase [Bacteroidales bacterium]|nr:DHH family phosphoesterase [Bacteroidales bacterium]